MDNCGVYLGVLKRIFMFRITQVQFVSIISICVFIKILLHLFRIIYNKEYY